MDHRPPRPKTRPKVAEKDRKRARKACTLCQIRKAKCVKATSGACVNCARQSLPCSLQYTTNFDASTTSRENESIQCSQSSTSANGDDQNSSSRSSIVPRIFNSIRLPEQPDQPDLILEDLSSKRLLEKIADSMFLSDASTASSITSSGVPRSSSDDLLIKQARNAFPPRHIADFLCNVCINYGTDYLFYFPHRKFRKMLHAFYADPESCGRLNKEFLCMALSCFAIGSQFAHLVDSRLSSIEFACLKTIPGIKFYNSAQALVPSLICDPSVESAQAFTMLSIYAFPFDARGASWSYLGLALRTSLSIGLHKDTLDTELSEADREIRRRTWWSIFLTERVSAIKLGLPEGISEVSVTTPLPQACWALDQGQVNNNLELLLAYISLAKIWRAISESVPSVFRPITPRSVEEIHYLIRELDAWRSSLPDSLTINGINKDSKLYRAVIHIHANYYHAWIILCREPLIALVKSKMANAAWATASSGCSSAGTSQAQEFSDLCLNAARSMLRLYEMLRKDNILARFSFTDFQGCSTSAIIMLLYGVVDRDETYDDYVDSAFEALSYMGTGCDKAQAAVQFIRGFRELTDEAYKRARNLSTNPTVSTTLEDLELYEEWVVSCGETERAQNDGALSLAAHEQEPNCVPLQAENAASMVLATDSTDRGNDMAPVGISGASDWQSETIHSTWLSGVGNDRESEALTMDDLMNSSIPESFVADVTGINLLDFGF